MPEPAFSQQLNDFGMGVRVAYAKNEFDGAWNDLKTTISNLATVDLSGTASLPCFDTWYLPGGSSVQLCFDQFATELGYVSQGILLIAAVTALSIIFRG